MILTVALVIIALFCLPFALKVLEWILDGVFAFFQDTGPAPAPRARSAEELAVIAAEDARIYARLRADYQARQAWEAEQKEAYEYAMAFDAHAWLARERALAPVSGELGS